METAMRGSATRMTWGEWTAGCLVMAAAVAGLALSAPWVERTFARTTSTAADSANAPHKRSCVSISGARFEWNFPNPPFGTLSCSE
jgi:hypothetical protein